ncbi:arginine:ornithine antiporter [Alicyclobacillus contaminans]|uniref:amino acid permease n=1 Tax=Alicyclobacillus contaminans TaxID=392016 RepID=UPI000419871F|nr:amino acid permease [Alicyclobacillus contaminans]GMA50808.1 arginine:ornithine antiporter [Alicyclobacillus contaminans]
MKNGLFGIWILTALVVGNMVGSGIFMLPSSLAQAASPAGVLLAWCVTGLGVLMLALVFGNLAIRRPELNGGPQAYARAIFRAGTRRSDFAGYMVAWGYWAANWSGNVATITTFASYLSTFFPVMASQAVLFQVGRFVVTVGGALTFLVCSALLWVIHALIVRGIEGAGKVNLVATTAKVLGFVFFIVVCLFTFEKANLLPLVQPRTDASGAPLSLLGQVNHAALSTLWAFVGVESAVVLSARARKAKDIKVATILGLLIALAIYVGITLLTMGALPQHVLMETNKPLIDALDRVIGSGGAYVMAGLGLISLVGSTIGWILLSAEVPYQAAKDGMFPKWFAKQNQRGTPTRALTVTNVMSQILIFSTLSESMSGAFTFVITLATLSYLLPYLVSTVYHVVMVVRGETYDTQPRGRLADGIIAVLASVYSVWVVKAGSSDWKTFLLGVAMLAVGMVFFPLVPRSRKESGEETRPISAEVGASSSARP